MQCTAELCLTVLVALENAVFNGGKACGRPYIAAQDCLATLQCIGSYISHPTSASGKQL
jgi:hypothetical protein